MTKVSTPIHAIKPTAVVYRIYRARDRDGHKAPPWHFSSVTVATKPGRFDLAPPNGTCYTSDRSIGAWLEVFRNQALVLRTELDKRLLGHMKRAGSSLQLADLCRPWPPQFQITLDTFSGDDYAKTQSLASQFNTQGLNGIYGFLRHDNTATARNIALFGATGNHSKMQDWESHSTAILADKDLMSALAARGISIVPEPYNVGITNPPI